MSRHGKPGDVRTKRIGESEGDYQYVLEYWYESDREYGWRPLTTYSTFTESLNASYRAMAAWQKWHDARNRHSAR